jgi:hypothetical protein
MASLDGDKNVWEGSSLSACWKPLAP